MVDIQHLINGLGGATAFGRIIGVKPSTASEMKRRKKIPVEYWTVVIAAAHHKGLKINVDDLLAAHSEPSNAA